MIELRSLASGAARRVFNRGASRSWLRYKRASGLLRERRRRSGRKRKLSIRCAKVTSTTTATAPRMVYLLDQSISPKVSIDRGS